MSYHQERLEAAARELLALSRQAAQLLERGVNEPTVASSRAADLLPRAQQILHSQIQNLERRLFELRGPFAVDSQLSEMYYGRSVLPPAEGQHDWLGTGSPSRRLCEAHTIISSLQIGYSWVQSAANTLRDLETASMASAHQHALASLAAELKEAICSTAAEELGEPEQPVEEALPPRPLEPAAGYHPHAG